jgi:uncharacterized membrane protein YGL010W
MCSFFLSFFFSALVSAPYFVFFEALFFFGYRPELYKEVMMDINKDVAEFKASKLLLT